MRLGLDLDNSLICYDQVFFNIAKELDIVPSTWQGNKRQLKEYLYRSEEGRACWQKLQGMVYGRLQSQADFFRQQPTVAIRVVHLHHTQCTRLSGDERLRVHSAVGSAQCTV